MYAFQDMVWEFGGLITSPRDQAEEERRSIALQYIKGLWPLVRERIINNHYVFNDLLLYLDTCSAKFELDGVPAAHPQAVL